MIKDRKNIVIKVEDRFTYLIKPTGEVNISLSALSKALGLPENDLTNIMHLSNNLKDFLYYSSYLDTYFVTEIGFVKLLQLVTKSNNFTMEQTELIAHYRLLVDNSLEA